MNGIILLNKALGVSSNRAMQQVKRLFGAKKAGHTGNLDPQATGMLPICLGEATKFAQYLLDADKIYEVEGCFGKKTTSGDSEGDVLTEVETAPFMQNAIQATLDSFLGESHQVPPMFSALKYKGQPLYRYALKGIDIQRQSRAIYISSIQLIEYQHPFFRFRVKSSKGTYMRSLIEDIAERLGTVAYVNILHRVSTAGFESEGMISFSELEQLSEPERLKYILPMDQMVQQFPALHLQNDDVLKLQYGQIVQIDNLVDTQIYRLYADQFVGLGQYFVGKGLLVKRLCQY